MLKIGFTQGKRYTFASHINDMLVPREKAEVLEAFRVIVEPGKQTHLHSHSDTEQLYFVVSGRGRGVFVHPGGGREEFDMAPDDVIHVPRNTQHQISCAGDASLVYLCVDGFPQGRPVAEPTWDDHYAEVLRLQSQSAAPNGAKVEAR